MQLLDQHAKAIMEECKVRARGSGLQFDDESLEFIVTNKDMVDLKPKIFIPTLYDYWVDDVETLQERGSYEVFPHNAYETVVNTRPAMSFYNDNNPDWLNVMIFYHVLGHIDFFQNNAMFKHTWSDDFAAQALTDKRVIADLRSEHGRWLDYVIEFARGIDNLVGYYQTLANLNRGETEQPTKVDFFFDSFLQSLKKVPQSEYLKYLDLYNSSMTNGKGEEGFFGEVALKYPELEAEFEKFKKERKEQPVDVIEHIVQNSPFMNKKGNEWMKEVVQIVRKTSLYFQPQMREKFFAEGWASYWHDRLFIQDERVRGNEVKYAKIHANVTALSRNRLNPYAIGMRLLQHIEEMTGKGKYSYEYQQMQSIKGRESYDRQTGKGTEFLLSIREDMNDFMLINTFVDQEFVDRYKLFVTGRRFNREEGVWERYIKSRKAEDYKRMLVGTLYHPPNITVEEPQKGDALNLVHHFEGKGLVDGYIPATMIGLEYLWGGTVTLKTNEFEVDQSRRYSGEEVEGVWRKVLFTAKDRKVTRQAMPLESKEAKEWFEAHK